MSTATRKTPVDSVFDAVIDRQASVFDAIRSGNDRLHRFNRSVIEGARQGSRDWAEVGRRWITNPADVVGLYESMSEAFGNSQARTLALAREWIEDVVESQRETREVVRQGFGDMREAVQTARERVPNFLRRRTPIPADSKQPRSNGN